ncbi:hypothetical protein ACFFX0_21185 [Citricoccus parietis]|uniref:Uncharacterized protein n=1 Tax=Citricoccus parietis TaxID=592307 RepID=A0ABV5G3R8_9MICC
MVFPHFLDRCGPYSSWWFRSQRQPSWAPRTGYFLGIPRMRSATMFRWM